MNITRNGKTTGRWPSYVLIVNGVEVGTVRRTFSTGCDRMAKSQMLGDGWAIHGIVLETREKAEATLIERAKRFGTIAA